MQYTRGTNYILLPVGTFCFQKKIVNVKLKCHTQGFPEIGNY